MTTPAWEPNRIFSFSERWNDQGDGEITPQSNSPLLIVTTSVFSICLPFLPPLFLKHAKKITGKQISSFNFLSGLSSNREI